MDHPGVRVVIVNPVYDDRDASPDAALDRFTTLTGWARAVRAQDVDVAVVQRFAADARIDRDGVAYHFVADALAAHAAARSPSIVHVNGFDQPRLLLQMRRALPRTAMAVQDHGGIDPARISSLRRTWLRYGIAAADV